MIHAVTIPQLGMVTESLRVVGWLAEVGEAVEAGQAVAEVETDKATTEVPAPEAGFLRRRTVELDAELSVGDTIAIVTTTLEEPAEATSAAVAGGGGAAHPAAPAPGSPIRALPAARRIARERGVELAGLVGSGPNGTITVADVEGAAAAAGPGVEAPASAAPANSAPASDASAPSAARRATARIVTESWKIPQFWVRRTVDLRAAERWLGGDAADGVSLSDVLVWSCARTLRAHPDLLPPAADAGAVGISYLVATERALLAPTVAVADGAPIAEAAVTRRATVARALADRLGAADVRGGQFAVSNLGLSGIDGFSALVLPGQHGVLAVGRRRPEVRIEDGAAIAVPVFELVLSVDHRQVDGAQAAAFLTDLAAAIERFGGDDGGA